MAPSDSRSVNCYGHGHLVCKFPINVTVPTSGINRQGTAVFCFKQPSDPVPPSVLSKRYGLNNDHVKEQLERFR